MATIPETLALAVRHHQAGDLPQAERIYRQVLRKDPNQADALHLLGLVAHQVGKQDEAIDLIRRAISVGPRNASYYSNLGAALRQRGNLDDAVAAYQEALQIKPDYAEAHHNLAKALKHQGKLDEAVVSYRRALQIKPDYAEAHMNLGVTLKDQGKLDEALAAFQRALQIRPDYVAAYNNLGVTLKDQGKLDEAVVSYQRALQVKPDFAEAHMNLGSAQTIQGKLDEAMVSYQRALQIRPDYAEAHYNLGIALKDAGKLDEAVASHQRAVQIKADYAEAHMSLGNLLKGQGKLDEAAACYREVLRIRPDQPFVKLKLAALGPEVFSGTDEIDRYRREFLDRIEQFSERETQVDLSELSGFGCEPPFGLMYHGEDDRSLKEAYAEVFHDRLPTQRRNIGDGVPRIGFVVTAGHEGIFERFMRGIVENISRDIFDPMIICSNAAATRFRHWMGAAMDRLVMIPNRFDLVVEKVRNEQFDILYHWEVGTDTINYFLPFCRLAPVQCTSWGVPVTSGIREIDYYLSSELLETEEAAEHYTEELVKLKTLPTYYHRPHLPQGMTPRSGFGLPDGRHLYLAPQNLQKFHPDFDQAMADVLRRDPKGIVVLVEGPYPHLTRQLVDRFDTTIPDCTGRIHFVPRQTREAFLSLMAQCDVLLDPFHYGGGNTTYESLALGSPIVTWPSAYLRGRVTHACYKKMDLLDCVASSKEEYVEIAVRLGTDSEYREAIRSAILASCHVLFEEIEAVREMEQFFQRVIEARRDDRKSSHEGKSS